MFQNLAKPLHYKFSQKWDLNLLILVIQRVKLIIIDWGLRICWDFQRHSIADIGLLQFVSIGHILSSLAREQRNVEYFGILNVEYFGKYYKVLLIWYFLYLCDLEALRKITKARPHMFLSRKTLFPCEENFAWQIKADLSSQFSKINLIIWITMKRKIFWGAKQDCIMCNIVSLDSVAQ